MDLGNSFSVTAGLLNLCLSWDQMWDILGERMLCENNSNTRQMCVNNLPKVAMAEIHTCDLSVTILTC